jgi:hypothetical protein
VATAHERSPQIALADADLVSLTGRGLQARPRWCCVNIAQSLWAPVQGDPVFMRRVNGWLAVFWLGMIPVSYELGWLNSVVYVSALSLWALVSGHWSAWQAARVEVAQEKEAKKLEDEPVEERVVEKIVEKTDVGRRSLPPGGPPSHSRDCLPGNQEIEIAREPQVNGIQSDATMKGWDNR